MPFGAEIDIRGSTHFRLWAPAAKEVALVLGTGAASRELRAHPMGDGWFAANADDAGAGTRYAFRIDGARLVPDPASRCNPDDVHAASMVVDPEAFDWSDAGWIGRPWEEAVIYELHIGAFTTQGTFAAARDRLAYLADLGVTCIELMPIADFPGRRNWGYDGVLLFAPDASYGRPDELKRLIDAAHRHRLMVMLDVVYNHFGPDGNYLGVYAPYFFNPEHQTPWGAAINFDGERSRTVRDFFIHNALYWLEEYGIDGLRMDAVDRIVDESTPDILIELATRVHEIFDHRRYVHIVLENDRNQTRYLQRDEHARPRSATAQWSDDTHHAAHVLITGETGGYYQDYAARPLWYFGRALAHGFAYQGEASAFRGGKPRGDRSTAVPPSAFVNFLQTHDQVGNRALGERLVHLTNPRTLRAALACVLLAPSPPLLFMGEEFAASGPFLFFCDFKGELAAAVTQGRRREVGRFEHFRDPTFQSQVPDPNADETFERCKLNWNEVVAAPHDAWLAYYRRLLLLRAAEIVPRLRDLQKSGHFEVESGMLLKVEWTLADASRLRLIANFDAQYARHVDCLVGRILFATDPADAQTGGLQLAPRAVVWLLEGPE